MAERRLGRWGESLAAAYLVARGYRIVRAGWRAGRYGEVDLIVRRRGVLAFVEVKTRRGRARGGPLDAVGPSKQRRLVLLAEMYLARLPPASPLRKLRPRMDVVAVERAAGGLRWSVRHLPGAFDATPQRRTLP